MTYSMDIAVLKAAMAASNSETIGDLVEYCLDNDTTPAALAATHGLPS